MILNHLLSLFLFSFIAMIFILYTYSVIILLIVYFGRIQKVNIQHLLHL